MVVLMIVVVSGVLVAFILGAGIVYALMKKIRNYPELPDRVNTSYAVPKMAVNNTSLLSEYDPYQEAMEQQDVFDTIPQKDRR